MSWGVPASWLSNVILNGASAGASSFVDVELHALGDDRRGRRAAGRPIPARRTRSVTRPGAGEPRRSRRSRIAAGTSPG